MVQIGCVATSCQWSSAPVTSPPLWPYPSCMTTAHKLFGIASILCALTCTDCQLFRTACDAALPVIARTQTLSVDAAGALEQAQAAVSMLQLPPNVAKEVAGAFERAWACLRAADASMVLAAQACTAPDVSSLYADFVLAWNAIKALVPLLGEPVAVGGVGGNKPRVADPMVVGMTRAPQTQK